MLPFHKRNARLNEVEDLQTSDIEVVRSRTGAHAAARPYAVESSLDVSRTSRRAPLPSAGPEDEVTRLMPVPSHTSSMMPPPPDPVLARTPASFPRGRAVLDDGPTRQHVPQRGMTPMNTSERNAFLNRTGEAAALRGGLHRTGDVLAARSGDFVPYRSGDVAAVRQSEPPPSPFRASEPPPAYRSGEVPAYRSGEVAAIRTGEVPFGFSTDRRVIPQAPNSVAPMAMNVAFNTPTAADRRRAAAGVPGTVITTKTRMLSGKPAISWAAALVAMGIFTGLVTAVLARGEGDAMVDATAAFVDPARGAAATNPTPAAAPAAQSATPAATTPGQPAQAAQAAQPAQAAQAAQAAMAAASTPASAQASAHPLGPVEGSSMAAAVGFAKAGGDKAAADKAATDKKSFEAKLAALAPTQAPAASSKMAAAVHTAAAAPAPAPAPRTVHVAAPKASEHAMAKADEPADRPPQKIEKIEKVERVEKAADKGEKGDKGGEKAEKDKKLADAAKKLADEQLAQSL